MINLDVFIPKKDFDKFVSKYENQKTAIDSLSIGLEKRIRTNRLLMNANALSGQEHEKVTIPIKDFLLPFVNEYCILKGVTKQELIVKIMKGKRI
jgi:hypothetical protein